MSKKFQFVLTAVLAVFVLSSVEVVAQDPQDITPSQRLEVMRQKLDRMKRSLSSASSVLRAEDDDVKGSKDDPESPLGRLISLEKEVSSLESEVNSLRGKVQRADEYEISDVDGLEDRVSLLQSRVDNGLLETADARAQVSSDVGQPREKKKKKKFLWIFGGGGDDEYEELIGNVTPGRDRELFIVATREVRKKNYEVGRLLFQTIVTTYPDSPYLPMAKLAIADSFYLEGNTSALIQAAAAYQDWRTFFPTHPLADRVLLKIAESEMRQIGLPDRDITRAKRAEQRLRALLQMYPDTILRPQAEQRLKEVQDNLGMHNLIVGNFYYKQAVKFEKGGLKGAQSRYLENLDKYPEFSLMDEVLYKLAVTYQIEEETDEAAKYFQRLVRDFPNSDYVEKAKEQLNLIGATIPEPNPERKDVLPPEKASFFENFKNEFLGIYPLTIDKNGVLMTKEFDEKKFELIDQIIENQGELDSSQIPKALTTVISESRPEGGPR
ncbi:MAG: outer membrane protein assembly factor BamD [Acidobacteria bacterium]|nr:MAG: outer membrane protein assembly factor BamD [Acidobacteriota bacterium]REK01300.1 MAG: outer membrane protein assembly factor BamD [Acidobacteriota bacterium]REK14256.1 MAG: outer membrane protein assembly factor BamD [Acidobacteriota bacterium]REK44971.1 MAG: outer membrane protein assembly factor BamD [Acidobacteriota bacterium]